MRGFPDVAAIIPVPHDRGPLNAEGIVIHTTDGGSWETSAMWLNQSGLGYHYIISRSGAVIQHYPIHSIAWHAGKSYWNGRHACNKWTIGISLCSWGRLTRELKEDGSYAYFCWPKEYHTPLPKTASVNTRAGNNPQNTRIYAWEAATEKQIESLNALLVHFVKEGIPVENICGHDECSPGRKDDPGGVLPISMPELRARLKANLDIIHTP